MNFLIYILVPIIILAALINGYIIDERDYLFITGIGGMLYMFIIGIFIKDDFKE